MSAVLGATNLETALTVPEELAHYSEEEPRGTLYTYSGRKEISAREFERATHRAAHRLCKDSEAGTVVAIIAVYDVIVYEATMVGLMSGGLIPFPISPRLPPSAVAHLLRAADVHRVIVSKSSLPALEQQIVSQLEQGSTSHDIVFDNLPSLKDIFPKLSNDTEEDSSHVPFPLRRRGLSDVALILHSSGSTGLPKPIGQTYRFLANAARGAFASDARKLIPGDIRFAGMYVPPFHQMGNFALLVAPICCRWRINLFPPSGGPPPTPSPDSVLQAIFLNKSNLLMTPPLFLQTWANQPAAVEYLRQLPVVTYGGGPLARNVGDALVQAGVKLRPAYGATEFVSRTCIIPRRASEMEWGWLEFAETAPARWEEQGEGSRIFEAILLHSDSWALAKENLPNGERGYATSDLFEKHPTKEGLWRIIGRKDDLLVHTTGEKTIPSSMENIIKSHPMLKGALMFGHQRDFPGVLVDPQPEHLIDVTDENAVATFRNAIWPIVAKANDIAPAYSKLYKEMILIASSDKRPAYTMKETISRRAALDQYRQEIDAIYDRVDAVVTDTDLQQPSAWTESALRDWLTGQVKELLKPGTSVKPDRDLFEQGLDSLGATILRLRLLAALKYNRHPSAQVVNEATVYTYPSINGLASLVAGSGETRITMEDLIEKYSAGLGGGLKAPGANKTSGSSKYVVLLTGSTGNLGAEILLRLLSDDKVDTVYTFNRPARDSTAAERHRSRFEDRGFDVKYLHKSKLVYLEGDASSETLGLAEIVYEQIRKTVSVVIHSAWTLDFNLSVSSYEVHIGGMRNLLKLAQECDDGSGAKFVFISSVAVAQSWDPSKDLYPENLLADISSARGMGYGESKCVAEHLLSRSGLCATSLRIDQISGAKPAGAWAMSDWVPTIVKTSLTLSMLPDGPGLVHWVPMDVAATAVLDIACSRDDQPTSVNVSHPRPSSWTDVIDNIRTALAEAGRAELSCVPWSTWLEELEKRQGDQHLDDLPALKLLPFMRRAGNALARSVEGRFDTRLAQKLCPAFGRAEPLNLDDARVWIKYWLRKGL